MVLGLFGNSDKGWGQLEGFSLGLLNWDLLETGYVRHLKGCYVQLVQRGRVGIGE